MGQFIVETPHAAVLVWNYVDRVGIPTGDYKSSGIAKKNLDKIEGGGVVPVIVSTLSCISIQTSKSKGLPGGTFNLVLAPFKNWVGNLTAGSWCCILMSNKTITEDDLKTADKDKVKMFGRIESVRCETKMNDDGTRQTLYYVTGTDWGEIFNCTLYIDNLIRGPKDKGNQQTDVLALAMRAILFGKDGNPAIGAVHKNLNAILRIMGSRGTLKSRVDPSGEVHRLAGSIYEFALPALVIKYFDFRTPKGDKIKVGKSLNNFLSLINGKLVAKDTYGGHSEASGFVDPFSLQGTHSLWQVLLENSNPALNEMLCDLRWNPGGNGGVTLALYNRIKPFAYKNFNPKKSGSNIKSYFQYVKTNVIDNAKVISINAGTNWRDKVNFIEIKPSFSEFQIIATIQKQKTQAFDPESFKREGFRALIVDTKQFPVKKGATASYGGDGADWAQLENWVFLMREWFFGTHRQLNGTLIMQGSTPYIGIGENILFDAALINPTPNLTSATVKAKVNPSILAHIESVQHSFSVDNNGARTYRTTIQFVRGITVQGDDYKMFGEGMLDQDVSKTSQSEDRNRRNTVSTSDIPGDPDPQKVKGT